MSKSPIPIVSLQIAGVCGALENLADRGYDTLEKVAATADAELRRTRGVGPLTLEKIKLAAASHGIPWTGKPYIPNLRGPIIKFDQTNASMQVRDWFAAGSETHLRVTPESADQHHLVHVSSHRNALPSPGPHAGNDVS